MDLRRRDAFRNEGHTSAGLRYGVAVIATLAALAVRLSLDPILGMHSPYLPFVIAIIVAARFGGREPGFVSAALSTLGVVYFFIAPRYTLGIDQREATVALLLFLVVGIIISLLVGHLRASLIAMAQAEAAVGHKTKLIELSHDAIVTMDPQRRIIGWNAGATEMYGWTEGEALGHVIHDLLHTSDHYSAAEIDSILQRDDRWDGELNHIARDGRRLIVESRQVLLRGDASQPEGILEINRDATERKHAEQESRRANEQRRLALESAQMGTWSLDIASSQVTWDRRCADIFGFAHSAEHPVAYSQIQSRIHPDDRAGNVEAIRKAVEDPSGGEYDREFRVLKTDGTTRWVASHGNVISEGEPDHSSMRMLGVCMEITERRQAEERFREAQKLQSVGLLAGGVAHDFNNLLTVIMGNASLLLEGRPSCEFTQAILSASERAVYLTKQLLAYAGKGQIIVKVIDLTSIVTQSRPLLSASVPKRVNLAFNLAQDLPYLEVDPSRIEQILMNLVINAGESIPPQSDGQIEIATSRCEVAPDVARLRSKTYEVAAGTYVCLEVRDNGSGMDEATSAQIFEPFFSTKFTGRGLGLAAVYGIVRSSRGFIDVQSARGVGTTFRVLLPASQKTQLTERAPGTPNQLPAGRSTILVVDDEEMVRRLACVALTNYGYDVLEAKDGKEALQLLTDLPVLPSLVLLDLAMPVMGGDELVPILGKQYPDLKIVLSSGYPEEEARKGFRSDTVAGFVQKPYAIVALADKIAQVLRGGSESTGKAMRSPGQA
jgi:two-component system, cell cycle sensor histidine kinase and response regulator CckA